MKTQTAIIVLAILLAAPLHAQTTQTEIQADLLGLQITAAIEAEDYAEAARLFGQYDAIGATVPAPMQLQRAEVYFRLNRYLDAEDALKAYLGNAERGSVEYRRALRRLAEVTPLTKEVKKQQAATCKGKDASYAVNEGRDETPLHAAAKANACLSALRLLIELGTDIHAKDKYGQTPLHMAAENNATLTAALLIDLGADVHARAPDGDTPLHSAAFNDATETAALLIKHGADVNVRESDGDTPLHKVNYFNATEIAALLIKHGAQVNAKNNDGETPLHIAAFAEALETAALLIQHGADVNVISYDGNTPLNTAKFRRGNDDVAALLRRHGGRCNKGC